MTHQLIIRLIRIDWKGLIIALLITLGIASYIGYSLANQVCLKSEGGHYYRTEYVGIFSIPVQVETTKDNSDFIGDKCIQYYKPDFFDINNNLMVSIKYFGNRTQ